MALGFYVIKSDSRKCIVTKTAIVHDLIVLKHEETLLPIDSLQNRMKYHVMDMLPFFKSQPRTFVDSSRTIQNIPSAFSYEEDLIGTKSGFLLEDLVR